MPNRARGKDVIALICIFYAGILFLASTPWALFPENLRFLKIESNFLLSRLDLPAPFPVFSSSYPEDYLIRANCLRVRRLDNQLIYEHPNCGPMGAKPFLNPYDFLIFRYLVGAFGLPSDLNARIAALAAHFCKISDSTGSLLVENSILVRDRKTGADATKLLFQAGWNCQAREFFSRGVKK